MRHRLLTLLRRGLRALVALGARPVLRFANELAQLRNQRARVRTLAIEHLDAFEPSEHRACLVHALNVEEKRARLRAVFVSTCSAQREVARRAFADAENRIVERGDESAAIAVHDDLDEGAAHRIGRRCVPA